VTLINLTLACSVAALALTMAATHRAQTNGHDFAVGGCSVWVPVLLLVLVAALKRVGWLG
jgi:F0F1-type ATP synthase assembly protein I